MSPLSKKHDQAKTWPRNFRVDFFHEKITWSSFFRAPAAGFLDIRLRACWRLFLRLLRINWSNNYIGVCGTDSFSMIFSRILGRGWSEMHPGTFKHLSGLAFTGFAGMSTHFKQNMVKTMRACRRKTFLYCSARHCRGTQGPGNPRTVSPWALGLLRARERERERERKRW